MVVQKANFLLRAGCAEVVHSELAQDRRLGKVLCH